MRGRALNFRIHAQSVSTLAKSIAPHWQYPATIELGKTRQSFQTERQPTALLCSNKIDIIPTQIRDSRSPMNAPERPKKEVNDSLEQSVANKLLDSLVKLPIRSVRRGGDLRNRKKFFSEHVPIYV